MLLDRIRKAALLGAAGALAVLSAATVSLESAVAATGSTPAAADTGSAPLSMSTVAGLHNAFNKAGYPFLAQNLDAGANMLELDPWTDVFGSHWKVSDSNPFGNDNDCVDASTPADLYRGVSNKDLPSCLDDVRVWLSAHPTAGPIYLKIEMKAGFQTNLGMGPADFDTMVNSHLGNLLYRPADLLGNTYPTPDAAAKANAWPSRNALTGKVIMYLMPGSVDLNNPLAPVKSDEELAVYEKNLAAAGKLAQATTFPSVLGATTGDPRTRYADTSVRPWFVFFDGDAQTYYDQVDTSWYDTNHYILVMTDAQRVAPALDLNHPSVADAKARVALLASRHASVVSSDWFTLPAVLSMTLPRG